MWAPDYADVDELAAFVRIPDEMDDAFLALALAAASRAVDRACNRQFGLEEAPAARYYTAEYNRALGRWAVVIDDLMTTDGLVVMADYGEQTYDTLIDEIALAPINAAPNGRPWTEFTVQRTSAAQPSGSADAVEVTARWGWTTIPDAIAQATLLQAARFLQRRNAPFGVAGSPADGSEIRLLAKLDPDVAVTVAPFVRWWGAE